MPTFSDSRTTLLRLMPREISPVVNAAVGLLAMVAIGALIAAALPAGVSEWLTGSCYVAPASVAFVAHWWMSQD